MRLKGKISWWFYGCILLIAFLLVPQLIRAVIEQEMEAMLLTLITFILIESLFISIAVHNYVEMQEHFFVIVFGFIRKKIPYDDIVSLSETNNPLSSLAASLDRIEILCKNKTWTMISVVDKELFLNEAKKRNPNIIIKRKRST